LEDKNTGKQDLLVDSLDLGSQRPGIVHIDYLPSEFHLQVNNYSRLELFERRVHGILARH
jgi:hypothetical protein